MRAYLSRPRAIRLDLLILGLTAMFLGYFAVWLPGPGVGLQLIGVEIGEWIKFLGVGPRRDLFYLPPVAIGLILALWTALWPNGRWHTWAARVLAAAVALLAFPAVAAIASEPRSQWLARLLLIGLVIAASGLSAGLATRPPDRRVWLAVALVAVAGAALPAWQYLAVRPVVAEVMRQPIGIGPGVWLNGLGGGLVAAVAMSEYLAGQQKRRPPQRQPS